MPRTLPGLIGFLFVSVLTVGVGLYVINRVGVLRNIVYGTQKAA